MKAVIIAGGRGERLKPITVTLPKVMVKVKGKPILEHILNLCKSHGINEFIFSLCFLPQKIISYFGDGSKFGVKISYIFEKESMPQGTAGAIQGAQQYIKETFIVTYGDILRELDIGKMISFHRENNTIATIAVYKNSSSDPKSIIDVDTNNYIKSFIERPKKSYTEQEVWSNASFYIFEPGIFDFIPKNEKTDFGKDVFPKLISSGEIISAFKSEGYFADIGNPSKLDYARRTFKINYPRRSG